MELDVPNHSHRVLKEQLQGIDKQKEIEIYYKLLCSGHSVGEILDSLSNIQCQSEHGNVTTAEHPRSGFDRVTPDVTSETVLAGAAQANIPRTSGLTSPLGAESCRTDESWVTESMPHDQLGSGKWGQLPGENLFGFESDFVGLASIPRSTDGGIEGPYSDQEPPQPGKFSNSTKRVAFGALYTAAVASVSIAGFVIVSSGRNAELGTTRIQSDMSGRIEAVSTPGLAAGGSEMVAKVPKFDKQVVNVNTSRASQSSQATKSNLAVSGPLQIDTQKDTTEAPPTFSAGKVHTEQAAPAVGHRDAIETIGSGGVSTSMAKEPAGQQIVRTFYAALEQGNGEAAASLVIPEKREVGPFSAGELSRFYGRLELPLRLIDVDRAGNNSYNVTYSYKARNGRPCNGRSLVTTINRQNQVFIEKVQSPSKC